MVDNENIPNERKIAIVGCGIGSKLSNIIKVLLEEEIEKEHLITEINVIFKDIDVKLLETKSPQELEQIKEFALQGVYITFDDAINDIRTEIIQREFGELIKELEQFDSKDMANKSKKKTKSWKKGRFYE